MKKQTFEILPLQGVYWKDEDLKLTFGMSVSEFDALLADGQKSQINERRKKGQSQQ